MSDTLKAVWTGQTGTLYSLSLESDTARKDYERLQAQTTTFPKVPTPEHPLRHVTVLTYLSVADLKLVQAAISKVLMEQEGIEFQNAFHRAKAAHDANKTYLENPDVE